MWRILEASLAPGYVKIAIEHGHRKFVSFPINSMVIFHSYVNVYQRVAMKLLNGPMVQYDMVHVWQNGQRLSSQGGPVIYVMHTRCMEYSKKLEGFKGGWQPKQLWCPGNESREFSPKLLGLVASPSKQEHFTSAFNGSSAKRKYGHVMTCIDWIDIKPDFNPSPNSETNSESFVDFISLRGMISWMFHGNK